METSGPKPRANRTILFVFWAVFALFVITTAFLLVAEVLGIWIGPVKMIITMQGPKSGILGGFSAMSNGELGYGLELVFSGLTRGVPGKINIVLFVILLVLVVYMHFSRKRAVAGAAEDKFQQ